MYKINEAAQLAGVSVRTLHHYDKIGLLKPAEIEPNGYRLYNDANFSRLQQILFFKELDFPLAKIKDILDDPSFDQKRALQMQKNILHEKKHRLERMIKAVEQTLQTLEGGPQMTKDEMFESFDMKEIEEHQKKYEKEVQQKYGKSDAYKQSRQRTASYNETDWQRIKKESDAIYRGLAEAMPKGAADKEAQQYIKQWREHITDNFYECTPEIFRGLGEMYVADPRFTKNIDKYQPGLARFMRDAIHIYCDRLETD